MITRAHRVDQIEAEDIPVLDWPEWYIDSIGKLKGQCLWCGKKLPNRRRHYCKSKDEFEFPTCKDKCRCAAHDLRVSPIRRLIHKMYDFECQECGEHFSYFTPAGAELPVHGGENHHIVALKDGGKDIVGNMILLCKKHHKEKTIKQSKKVILDSVA